jgi:hypothetical protein
MIRSQNKREPKELTVSVHFPLYVKLVPKERPASTGKIIYQINNTSINRIIIMYTSLRVINIKLYYTVLII